MKMREFPLTVSDQSEIDALKAKGLDAAQIAGELRRSKRAIAYYIRHRQSHCEKDNGE